MAAQDARTGSIFPEEKEKTQGKTIGSIQKAAEVLEILAAAGGAGLGATEISQRMGAGVSGTYHILNTLKLCRFIDQDPSSKKYRIGFGLYRLCSQSGMQESLSRVAQPYLDRLSRDCGEISNLILLDGLRIYYAAQASDSGQIRMFTQLGSSAPYYCTGAGKVLLAFRDPAEWDRYIKNTEFTRYTAHTITSRASLLKELETIRREGISFDREEREDGVWCVAAPVLDAGGLAAAAISISGPMGRIREKLESAGLADQLRKTAAALSEELR